MESAELLTAAQVADILKISVPVLGNWRSAGRGPRYLKLTEGQRGRVRYRRPDVDAFIASRTGGRGDGEDDGGGDPDR